MAAWWAAVAAYLLLTRTTRCSDLVPAADVVVRARVTVWAVTGEVTLRQVAEEERGRRVAVAVVADSEEATHHHHHRRRRRCLRCRVHHHHPLLGNESLESAVCAWCAPTSVVPGASDTTATCSERHCVHISGQIR